MVIYLFFLIQIIIDSLSDALNSLIKKSTPKTSSLQKMNHIVQAIHILIWIVAIGCVLTGVYRINFIGENEYFWIARLVIGYAVLRFAIFDFAFNLFAKKPRYYFGTSSYYDIIFNTIIKIFNKSESFGHWAIFVCRFTCIFVSYNIINALIN